MHLFRSGLEGSHLCTGQGGRDCQFLPFFPGLRDALIILALYLFSCCRAAADAELRRAEIQRQLMADSGEQRTKTAAKGTPVCAAPATELQLVVGRSGCCFCAHPAWRLQPPTLRSFYCPLQPSWRCW